MMVFSIGGNMKLITFSLVRSAVADFKYGIKTYGLRIYRKNYSDVGYLRYKKTV